MNNRILGCVALALAVFLAWQSAGLEAPFAYEPLGPKAFPLIIALIIAGCGLRLVLQGGGQAEANPPGANLRIGAMVAVVALYAIAFQWLGFVVATALMTAAIGRLFGGRWVWTVPSGIALGVAFFLLFDKVLDVVLPVGLLGDLL